MVTRIIATISLLIFTGLSVPYVFAENSNKANPANDIKCSEVQSNTSGSFYVVLEEPIGDPDAKYCFRVCTILDAKKDDTKTNICKIKDACKSDKDLGNDVSCQRIQIIKADSGANLIYTYIRMIYLWAAGTIGIISVFTFVYSGIGISMAGGDSGKIDNYKSRIMQSLGGLIILFLSGLILYTINPTFFV